MRFSPLIACLLIAGAAYGATPIIVNLGVADPATPRTYAAEPGKFDIKLINADPRKNYEIIGENRQTSATPKLPADFVPAASLTCDATDEQTLNGQVAKILAVTLQAKKDKTPEDKKADVKLTEADIRDALSGDFGCMAPADKTKLDTDKKKVTEDKTKFDADKTKLDADKTKFDADKAKFDTDTAKPAAEKARLDTEKARLDTEKTRLDAEKTRIDNESKRIAKAEANNVSLSKILDRFSVLFDGYTLKPGETIQKTFKAVGEDTTWTVVITTQGGSAETTAKAAAKAANPLASDSPILDRLLNTTATHPNLIIGTCKYDDPTCVARGIYINSDQISTLTITDIPRKGAVTVRVTAGEYYPCQAISYNIARYAKAPDMLILPLHMKKGFLGLGSVSGIKGAQIEAASIYGLDWCPGTNDLLRKKGNVQGPDESDTDYREHVIAHESVIVQADANLTTAQRKIFNWERLPQIPDPRIRTIKSPPIASLPLFLRGKSEVVEVQFDWEDGSPSRTFTFPVVYQHYWLDAGGFFVFTRRTDQSIQTQTLSTTPEKQKVLEIRRDVSIEPNTGIVINIHPGNVPNLAFQFAIAANQGRLPSYYFGLGYRAREIGKRGLATLGVGVAMQQEQQFPGLQFGAELPSTDPRLKPTSKYGITFPYISLSLGFSFGGVSEKTSVADGVQ